MKCRDASQQRGTSQASEALPGVYIGSVFVRRQAVRAATPSRKSC
jgi:hypothetical protein